MAPSYLRCNVLLFFAVLLVFRTVHTQATNPKDDPCPVFFMLQTITGVDLDKLYTFFLAAEAFPLDKSSQFLASFLATGLQPCLGGTSRILNTLNRQPSTEEEAREACRRAAGARDDIDDFDLPNSIRRRLKNLSTRSLVRIAARLLRRATRGALLVVELFEMIGNLVSAVAADPKFCDQACPCDTVRKGACVRFQLRGPDGRCVPPSEAGGGACPAPEVVPRATCGEKPWRTGISYTEISFGNLICLIIQLHCDPSEPCKQIGGDFDAGRCCVEKCKMAYCKALGRVYRARGFINPRSPRLCKTDSIGLALRIGLRTDQSRCTSKC